MQPSDHLWVVILAAGEGKRVKTLTRDRWGRLAPKQYSVLNGRTTLLDSTLERARKIAPCERIVVVVAAQHRRWWVTELAGLPARNVIVQPENRGTAAGILLPLVWILRRDPAARLIILPSDHGVASEETLHNAIVDALACAPHADSGMVLLGVQPQRLETDYGWIVPQAGGAGPLRRVACFREKPDAATAAALLNRGGLLNSFILIVGGRSLAAHFATTLPALWRSFQPQLDAMRDWFRIEQDLPHLYHSTPSHDFSKDLLERAADALWVHSVPACGWLDLGTPDRLAGHLLGMGRHSGDETGSRVKRWPSHVLRPYPAALQSTDPAIGGPRARNRLIMDAASVDTKIEPKEDGRCHTRRNAFWFRPTSRPHQTAL